MTHGREALPGGGCTTAQMLEKKSDQKMAKSTPCRGRSYRDSPAASRRGMAPSSLYPQFFPKVRRFCGTGTVFMETDTVSIPNQIGSATGFGQITLDFGRDRSHWRPLGPAPRSEADVCVIGSGVWRHLGGLALQRRGRSFVALVAGLIAAASTQRRLPHAGAARHCYAEAIELYGRERHGRCGGSPRKTWRSADEGCEARAELSRAPSMLLALKGGSGERSRGDRRWSRAAANPRAGAFSHAYAGGRTEAIVEPGTRSARTTAAA